MSSILYVWQSHYPWDIRVEKICNALAEAGHHVTLLTRRRVDNFSSSSFKIVEINNKLNQPLPFSPIWKNKIQEIIRNEKIDLVISRDFWVTPSAIQASRTEKIPCIIDMAEHYPAAMRGWKKYNSNPISRWLLHSAELPDRLEKWNVLNSDGVITVCDEQSQRLQKMGVNQNDLAVVGNTPDLNLFSKPFSVPKKIVKIGHHGFITPERGLDVLIKAFSIIKSKNPDIKLVLAGTGESSMEIQDLIEKTKINCEVHGRYQFQDLPRLISEVDAGILPYQLTEFLDHTLANKLFDYMACSRPVFVSATNPFMRIISETNAGWIVDVTSPENLARDILNACQNYVPLMAERGRKAIVEKYNWNVDKINLSHFTDSILNRKGK
jgi:glycosyltransferase involved in cell wall biosynthesis